MFIIFIILSTASVILVNDDSEKFYNPPKFDGEKIIPGHFNEKN